MNEWRVADLSRHRREIAPYPLFPAGVVPALGKETHRANYENIFGQ